MTKIIAANWKTKGLSAEVEKFANDIDNMSPKCTRIIFPSFLLIEKLKESFADKGISVGGQDCAESFHLNATGCITAEMLKDIGCEYVIIGHAERRKYFGENSAVVKNKMKAAIDAGLKPIVCFSCQSLDKTDVEKIIKQMEETEFTKHNIENNCIAACEPLSAIGGVEAFHPEKVDEAFEKIKLHVNTSVLYGGSVNTSNAYDLLKVSDGLLIGRASLLAENINFFSNKVLDICIS